jgi:hypothetical protein
MLRLDNIGVSKQQTVEQSMETLLAGFANLVIEELQKNLDQDNKNASSVLRQSIVMSVGDSEVSISMEDYWKFVDKGVQGNGKGKSGKRLKGIGSPYKYTNKMPPVSALKKYIMNKGISIKGYSDKKRSLRKNIRSKPNNPIDNAAFLMARSIQQYGVDGSQFYSDVVNAKAFKQLARQAEKTLGKQVIFEIRDGNNN